MSLVVDVVFMVAIVVFQADGTSAAKAFTYPTRHECMKDRAEAIENLKLVNSMPGGTIKAAITECVAVEYPQ